LDEAKNHAKITVKMNGKGGHSKETIEVHDWKTAEHEVAAAHDGANEEESFEWVLPELDADKIEEFRPIHYTPVPKKKSFFQNKLPNKKSMPAIIFSIASAVVIGALLGLVVLKFIEYGDSQTKKSASAPAAGSAGGEKQAQAQQLPALTVGILQAGVFSTKEAAAKVSDELAAKSVPSMLLTMDGQHYIFAGVAESLLVVKNLKTVFADKGVELYAKEISFSSKKIQTVTNDDQIFAQNTVPLFEKLVKETSNSFQTGTVSADGMQAMKSSAETISRLETIKQETLQQLKKYETAAYESLLSYEKSGNKQDLAKAEQNLLDYVKVYSGH